MINLFVYGTLMFSEVAQALAGPTHRAYPAKLNGFSRFEATLRSRGNFPFVRPDSAGMVEGLLLTKLSQRQLEIFDWFEGEGDWYRRETRPLEPSQIEWIEKPAVAEPSLFGVYIISDGLRCALNDYAASRGQSFREVAWDPKKFYDHSIGWYFWNTVLPTIEDPEFKKRFGQPWDQAYLASLKRRFAEERN